MARRQVSAATKRQGYTVTFSWALNAADSDEIDPAGYGLAGLLLPKLYGGAAVELYESYDDGASWWLTADETGSAPVAAVASGVGSGIAGLCLRFNPLILGGPGLFRVRRVDDSGVGLTSAPAIAAIAVLV